MLMELLKRYYACLCGHEELCAFLLANGARCEENTFDGERCYFAALTNEIQTMLKKATTTDSGKICTEYDDFLSR